MKKLFREMIEVAEREGLIRPKLEHRSKHTFVVGKDSRGAEVRVGISNSQRNRRHREHFATELKHRIERATGARQ